MSFFLLGAAPLQSVKVVVDDDEAIEKVLKNFKREVNKSGHLFELRFREQFENNAEKRKRRRMRGQFLNKLERRNDFFERRSFGASEYNS